MTVKQETHALVEELADDSPLLREVHEALRMNQALAESMADIRAGRVHEADAFMAKVRQRWPRKNSA